MITRGVKVQLLVFLVITVLGIGYTGEHYIGIGRGLFGTSYTAYVDMADSGGAFVNSEVTFRGVPVGRVTAMKLTPDGVRLTLNITSPQKISRNVQAVVADRSAVGEQYVDLRPRSDGGPYLADGSPYTIPAADTQVPTSTAALLKNVDSLVGSVDTDDLRTIVDELDKAFAGSAADLQTILDSSDTIIKAANDSYSSTKSLLDTGQTVLTTQQAKASAIKEFAANLATLTDSVRAADGSIRTDIDAVQPTVTQGNKLINDLAPTLPVLLSNLSVTTSVIDQRLPGLRSLLILYPATLGGAFTVTPGDGTEHFGLVLNFGSPAACTKGYEKAKARYPQDTSNPAAKSGLSCTLPKNSASDVRGSRNAPKPIAGPKLPAGATDAAGTPPSGSSNSSGDDASTSASANAPATSTGIQPYQSTSSDQVYVTTYDPVTGTFIGPDGTQHTIGSTGGQQRLLGDSSWKWLFLGPLAK